jgi:hypothetical protein
MSATKKKIFKRKWKHPRGYWQIKKNVINDAKKYGIRADWQKYSPGAHMSAYKNGWLDDVRKQIKSMFREEYGYWQIKKNLIKDAKKYKTRTEWQKNSGHGYQSARKNEWLEICCKHMTTKMGKWQIKRNVMNDAKKYKTRIEWIRKSPSGYGAAYKYGWLQESCKHMKLIMGRWQIKKNVIDDAKKYKTRNEWSFKSGAAYRSALKHGWTIECFPQRAKRSDYGTRR